MYNGIKFTASADIEMITENAFRILSEIGVLVDYQPLVELLLSSSRCLRQNRGRIFVERSLAGDCFFTCADKSVQKQRPDVHACAEIYDGRYLDPVDDTYKPWSEERLLTYIKLAKNLQNVGNASMLGCPIPTLDRKKQPLYEKLYTAKYGLAGKMGGYSIWDSALLPQLYDVWVELAREYGKPLEEVFNGGVYIISPLQLGKVEAEHLLWFRERGLRCFIGCMSALGMNAPVTPAGAISMQLAELMFASVLQRSLYGEAAAHIWSSLSVADMNTVSFRYGRPEQLLMNAAMCDIAAFYGMPYWGHDGLCDAKRPSYEAAAQKMGTALAHIMKGQRAGVCAGLLSVDEIYSPVQMVLDDELTGYLKHVCKGFDVSADTLAFEALAECVEEGTSFLSSEHTMENMRSVIWNPTIFSRDMYGSWAMNPATDCEKAKERAMVIINDAPSLDSQISESCERRILEIIQRA